MLEKRYLNTKEASHYTGWSKSYFDHIRITGRLRNLTPGPPFIKKGRRVLYDINDLDAWLRQHRIEDAVPIRPKLKNRHSTLPHKQSDQLRSIQQKTKIERRPLPENDKLSCRVF